MLDSQRRLARTILVGIVLAVVTFVLLASGPTFGLGFAQQEQPRIEFLNPSGTNFSEEISAKPDGRDSQYHLVAWVNQIPSNVGVEFRYIDPDSGNEVPIGAGMQSSVPDTFHTFWDPPATLPDDEDNVTLVARLLSGTTEVDRDTESDVFVNDQDPDPLNPLDMTDPRGETVEITYPAIGASWGLFTPRDRATAGLIDVSMSAGITFVRGVYSVSPPGSEPVWINCGTENRAAAANGVRCTLQAQHSLSQVVAVGAVANDGTGTTYSTANDDSSDAHRVAPYQQVSGTMAINPAQGAGATGNCSNLFTATLTDQLGVAIANANLDVHARGPVDEIAFDSGTVAGASKSPDQGSHSPSETARNCAADPPAVAGLQGEHNDPAATDIKHIETTTTAGTNDDGQWVFQLFSPAAGVTEFVVWSDHDDDDMFCSTEVSASGSVGWDQAAGVPTLGPELTSCPSPSPSSPAPGPTTPGPEPTPDPRGCTITGTDDADVLDGTEDDDIICAGDGNDIITGLGGADVIYGDGGRDDIRAGTGDDTVRAGTGKDTVRGDDGNDDLFGGDDNDLVTGGDGDDKIAGQTGFDSLRGGAGSDTVGGGFGSDNITGGPGGDFLFGGRGKDSLVGGSGVDRCRGNGGRDSFSGCEAQEQ